MQGIAYKGAQMGSFCYLKWILILFVFTFYVNTYAQDRIDTLRRDLISSYIDLQMRIEVYEEVLMKTLDVTDHLRDNYDKLRVLIEDRYRFSYVACNCDNIVVKEAKEYFNYMDKVSDLFNKYQMKRYKRCKRIAARFFKYNFN